MQHVSCRFKSVALVVTNTTDTVPEATWWPLHPPAPPAADTFKRPTRRPQTAQNPLVCGSADNRHMMQSIFGMPAGGIWYAGIQMVQLIQKGCWFSEVGDTFDYEEPCGIGFAPHLTPISLFASGKEAREGKLLKSEMNGCTVHRVTSVSWHIEVYIKIKADKKVKLLFWISSGKDFLFLLMKLSWNTTTVVMVTLQMTPGGTKTK